MNADDLDDPVERRRQQRERGRRRTLTLAIVGGGFLVAGLVITLAVVLRGKDGLPSFGGPSESSEGENRTHKELAEYLGKKGVKVEVKPGGANSTMFGSDFIESPHSSVRVVLCPNSKAAKEFAGSQDAGSFSWGHFAFVNGNGDLAARIRKALGVR